MIQKTGKIIIFFTIVATPFFMNDVLIFYKSILGLTNLQTMIITLIAGLFGFIVATIPFTIQILSSKSEIVEYLNKQERLDFYIKPLLKRHIIFLNNMLYVLFFYLLLYIFPELKTLISKIQICPPFTQFLEYVRTLIYSIFFFVYMMLLKNLFYSLCYSIRDMKNLKNIYIKAHKKTNRTDKDQKSKE